MLCNPNVGKEGYPTYCHRRGYGQRQPNVLIIHHHPGNSVATPVPTPARGECPVEALDTRVPSEPFREHARILAVLSSPSYSVLTTAQLAEAMCPQLKLVPLPKDPPREIGLMKRESQRGCFAPAFRTIERGSVLIAKPLAYAKERFQNECWLGETVGASY